MGIELERLEKLSERVHRLESSISALRSMILEIEATISDIMERLDACSTDSRDTDGATGQIPGTIQGPKGEA